MIHSCVRALDTAKDDQSIYWCQWGPGSPAARLVMVHGYNAYWKYHSEYVRTYGCQ